MSRIRATNTKPEEKVRKYLFSCGFRYRKNYKKLPGKPDIVLPKYKTAVFINGCFWHKHQNCKIYRLPKSNTEFWREKLDRNEKRDIENYKELKAMGWKVIVIWECELKKDVFEETMDKLIKRIVNNN